MTFEQFRNLELTEQIEILVKSGVAVAESHHQLYISFLYYLHYFFVVVIYEAETDELLQIIPLKQRDKQKNFVEQFPFYHSN